MKNAAQVIKEMGFTTKDVSVRTGRSAIRIEIKSPKAAAQYKQIEAATRVFEDYSTDGATGEILSGGNTFVLVNISESCITEMATPYMATAAEWLSEVSTTCNLNQGTSRGELSLARFSNGLELFKGSFICKIYDARGLAYQMAKQSAGN